MKNIISGKVRNIFLMVACCSTGLALASDNTIIIHAGHLLAIPGEAMLERQSIVIDEDKIKGIYAGFLQPDDARISDNAKFIDLSEQYVLPGLIDAHGHITTHKKNLLSVADFYIDWVAMTDEATALLGYANAMKVLKGGFTTIRNLGANGLAAVALRDMVNNGVLPGPRILPAISHMTISGGPDDLSGFRPEVMSLRRPFGVCDGADDCRKAVRLLIKYGADVIKIGATGWAESGDPFNLPLIFTELELNAIIHEAHHQGRKVAAHAHSAVAINAVLRAGVDSVEHGTFPDKESLRLYKKHNAYWVPTLGGLSRPHGVTSPTVEQYKAGMRSAEYQIKMLAEARSIGIKIVTGIDGANIEHGKGIIELVLLVEAGFSEMEAIVAATVNAAELLGLSDQLGSIVPGKAADIIAVDENPLENIEALLEMEFVMRDGSVYKMNSVPN